MWQTILLFGLILLCPLMHLFMMRGMHGKQHQHHCGPSDARKPMSKEEEMRSLKDNLDALQADYNRLSDELQNERNGADKSKLHIKKLPGNGNQHSHHHH